MQNSIVMKNWMKKDQKEDQRKAFIGKFEFLKCCLKGENFQPQPFVQKIDFLYFANI
jgi:hypothetical protein